MTLKEFALELRNELLNGEMPQLIAAKILAKRLTPDKNNIIINYLIDPNYNPQIGTIESNEADNSEFLKLVDIVAKIIKEK